MVDFSSETTGDVTSVKICGDLTIYEAAEFKERLIAELGGCRELNVDLSQVSEIDTSGIQVLMLAKQESARFEKQISLTAHSKATLQLLENYRLVEFFGDPVLMTDQESSAAH